ncbi:MAG: glycosyltransferase family 4 protein [Deltaproteobacteria bacterium]|nr:glycosyltransferase family 4 protein [Deltaproteobacteria bacterium]
MRRRRHVVYVCMDRGVPVGGYKGASAHVAELTNALVNLRCDVHIVAARSTGDASSTYVQVSDLGAERGSRRTKAALSAGAKGPREQAAATEARGIMLNETVSRTLEKIHKRRPIHAVYERYSLWNYSAVKFARAAAVPHLLEVNAPLREEQQRYRRLENPELARTLEHYIFSNTDRLIVPSSQLKPWVVEHGCAPGRVRVIPNAADPELFARVASSREQLEREEGTFVLGFLGSLKPWHGLDELLRAFRLLHRKDNSYRLLVVGEGPLRRELERSARSMKILPAVTFSGHVEHDEIPAWLARMDVGMAPYPKLAGFYFSPLKVFEYMAAGLPVVASDTGQIAELFTDRRNLLLHRPGAVREIADRVETLRGKPSLSVKLAAEARRMVNRRFTWRRNAERVLDMADRVSAVAVTAARTKGKRR